MSLLEEAMHVAIPAAREAEVTLRTEYLKRRKRPSDGEVEDARLRGALMALAEAGFMGPVLQFLASRESA